MPVNASANRFPIDAELVLRAKGQAAVTAASTPSNNFVLPRDDSYWGFGLIPDFETAVIIEVESIVTAGGETYNFEVQVDTASNFPSATTIAARAATGVGRLTLVIPREAIRAAEAAGATHLRVLQSGTGVGRSIAWNAYLAPLVGG